MVCQKPWQRLRNFLFFLSKPDLKWKLRVLSKKVLYSEKMFGKGIVIAASTFGCNCLLLILLKTFLRQVLVCKISLIYTEIDGINLIIDYLNTEFPKTDFSNKVSCLTMVFVKSTSLEKVSHNIWHKRYK